MTLVLIVWGVWSATKLPIDAVPDITNNQVQIITVCPTLAGQEVEQLVTFPIEQSIANLPDLEETRSISRFGLSVITVVFDEKVDIYFARQLISEKLKEAQEKIPDGIGTPELAPVSSGLGEVYQYIIHPKKGSENKYSAKDLRTFQDWIVARQLYGTPGIAEVNSFGGQLKQYEVAVNPDRLRAMGVSMTDIFNALQQNNQNTGGAYIDKKPNAYFIRGIGLVTSLDDVKNISVKQTGNSFPIFIKDVAEVRFGSAVRYGAMTYNGEVDAVGGVVMMLKGENANNLVKRIKEKLPVIQKSLPSDVVIEPYLDRTDLVGRAIKTVEKNLIEGALIVIFVLVVFLGNLRAGLIVASAIPLAMLFALGLMNLFGVSANLMSLGAIDFGLIVDGAVIIVEATLHHLGLRKTTNKLTQAEMDQEVFVSASKIRSSAAFGEIIILIVYIPILTLVGVEGKMFRPMAQTVGFAIFGALILSLTYIPMMSALCLSKNVSQKQNLSDKMIAWLQSKYEPLLKKAIQFKYAVVSTAVGLLAISIFFFSRMGGEFIPQLAEGDFAFHCILPQGSSLSQSIETSMQASKIIKQFDEVKMVVGKTGAGEVPTDPMPPEATDIMIILKPVEEWKSGRSYDELADAISDKLSAIPGVFFEKNQPIQMRFNELMTGIRQDVAVKIFGENLDTLSTYADRVSNVIRQVEGATPPQVERLGGLPQINVTYDRTRMANYGINVAEVNDVLSAAFAGKSAGVVFENERRFDLVVRLDSAYRTNIDDVSNLVIATANGSQIPLSQVADIAYKLGPAQISREAGKRRVVIGFNVVGKDVQTVVENIQKKLDSEVVLPAGYYFTYGGQFENLQQASNRLMIAVPASLLLIFILLYFTFSSMKQAALVFTAIPMSAIGGIFALMLRGMPFSISAGIGFIALFGVAVLNGIVLIGTFNQLEKEGHTNIIARVIEGAKIRLRPVLMTATVASLGFLPMALSASAGAEVQKPLATVVIGGLLTATLLTLFVIPLLYIIFNSNIKLHPKMNKALVVLALVIFSFSPKANAQQIVLKNFDDAIALAKANNNQLKANQLLVSANKALIKTAAELPKTEFTGQVGQYNSRSTDQSVQVQQAIPFPTVFGAKKEQLKTDVSAAEIQQDITLMEIREQLRTSYNEIEYLQYNQVKLKELAAMYNDFVTMAKLRYKAGDTKKVDINAAETKKGDLDLLLMQNELATKNAYKRLAAIINTDSDLSIAINTAYTPIQLNVSADSASLTNNPNIAATRNEIAQLSSAQKLQNAQNLPDITLGYLNQSLIGTEIGSNPTVYANNRDRFTAFTLGISIPIFTANRAKNKAAKYKIDAATAQLQQQQQNFTVTLQNAINQYELQQARYNFFKEKSLINADEILKAAKVGYKTGDISYVEYLYALEMHTDIQLNYLKSIQDANQAAINVFTLLNR